MPGLVGIICDDDGQDYSFAECLSCVRNGGPRRCQNPLPLIVAMSKNGEERKDAGLSATTVLDCPRKYALSLTHDFREKPSAYWARFRGTIGHLMMEAYGADQEGVIQEVRFKKDLVVDGVVVPLTGKMDWVDVTRGLILDYKSTDSINKQPVKNGLPKDGHVDQVSIYRWLLWGGRPLLKDNETGEWHWGDPVHYAIAGGGIVYFDMKGVRKVPIRPWPLDETEAYLVERVRPIARWRATGELPPVLVDAFGDRSWKCRYCPLRKVCDEKAGLDVEDE